MGEFQTLTQEQVDALPESIQQGLPTEVHAVAVSGNAASAGTSKVGKAGAKLIELGMVNAINYCYSNGITDPVKVREKMMEAREVVKRKMLEAEVTLGGNDEG